jgi:hypothetical protein
LSSKILPISDVDNLPVQYKLTLRARTAFDNDPNNKIVNPQAVGFERLLLHQENGMLIFASNDDLRVLHDSEFWVGDGTFEMCPAGFAQIYTIHGFRHGEGMFSSNSTIIVR